MFQQELLSFVIETLDRLGIEFMLTGSHASSFQTGAIRLVRWMISESTGFSIVERPCGACATTATTISVGS